MDPGIQSSLRVTELRPLLKNLMQMVVASYQYQSNCLTLRFLVDSMFVPASVVSETTCWPSSRCPREHAEILV